MNCKPGDLAVVVRSYAGNEGKIVRCIRLAPDNRWIDAVSGRLFRAATWVIDRQLMGAGGDYSARIEDSLLRPIQNPGDDVHDVRDILVPEHLKETA